MKNNQNMPPAAGGAAGRPDPESKKADPGGQTVEIEIERLGDVEVGQTITMRVDSVNEDTGMVSLSVVKVGPSKNQTSGIDRAAMEFEEEV